MAAGMRFAGARSVDVFLAHLPAGWLLSRVCDPRMRAAILIGSVLPDLDLLWFYGPGERAVNHHFYFTHFAWFWLGVAIWNRGLAIGALLHLVLDTVAGGIAWLHPFSRELFVLFEVARREGFWVWSFVLHPTFLLELAIVSAGTWRFAGAWRRALPSTSPS